MPTTTYGAAAAAAGVTTVSPLWDAREGFNEINRALDLLVTRKFGTAQLLDGAVTPDKLDGPVPITHGGTGAADAAGARANLGAMPVFTDGAQPARKEPGSTHSIGFYTLDGAYLFWRPEPSNSAYDVRIARYSEVAEALAAAAGAVRVGDSPTFGAIYSPHGRANPAASSWVAGALDSAGRICIQPSAARFKQDIEPRTYTLADAATIGRLVVRYRLIGAVDELGDAAPFEVGIIAEALIAAGFPEFVAFDDEGQPLTIHYAQLVTVAVSALVEVADMGADLDGLFETVRKLSARVRDLEGA
jgi:hypothetical protein